MRASLRLLPANSSATRLAKALQTAAARPSLIHRRSKTTMTQAVAGSPASAAAAPASAAAAAPALEPIGERKLRILCLHGYLQNGEVRVMHKCTTSCRLPRFVAVLVPPRMRPMRPQPLAYLLPARVPAHPTPPACRSSAPVSARCARH